MTHIEEEEKYHHQEAPRCQAQNWANARDAPAHEHAAVTRGFPPYLRLFINTIKIKPLMGTASLMLSHEKVSLLSGDLFKCVHWMMSVVRVCNCVWRSQPLRVKSLPLGYIFCNDSMFALTLFAAAKRATGPLVTLRSHAHTSPLPRPAYTKCSSVWWNAHDHTALSNE